MRETLLRIEASLTIGSADEPAIRRAMLQDVRDALSTCPDIVGLLKEIAFTGDYSRTKVFEALFQLDPLWKDLRSFAKERGFDPNEIPVTSIRAEWESFPIVRMIREWEKTRGRKFADLF